MGEGKGLGERICQGGSTGRVVRGVDYHGRPAPHDFKATRRRDRGEALPHAVGIEGEGTASDERLGGGERHGGIARLMRAEEGHEDVVVGAGQSLEGEDLATDSHGAIQHRECLAFPGCGHAELVDARLEHVGCLGILLGDDGEAAVLDDARLLRRDQADGVAKNVRMVHGDPGDDRHLRLAHGGRIPGPAHTDLDDGHVDRGIGEGGVGDRCERLEVRDGCAAFLLRAGVHAGDERGHIAGNRHEAFGRDGLAIDFDALAHVDQVRAGVEAGTQAESAQERGNHARRRGLAVGAGHLDDRVGMLRLSEEVHDRADSRQGRVDGVLRPTAEELRLELGVPRRGTAVDRRNILRRLGHVFHPSRRLLG